ncbi:MAG TPA: complex I NDUFA9 subunit family protein [Gammaproteobacteria bacterium]|nr:complex I NDUFA9 subunit family protein [Gammaproteobacteria bacterium]
MKIHMVCVLGGTGFVGRHLIHHLVADGYQVKVLTRHHARHRDLLVLPTLTMAEADIHDPQALIDHLAGCDAVINLVGILNEKGHDGSGFRRAHVELPRKIITACTTLGIKRLVHMSALNANAQQGPSHYLRSKGEGEDLVHGAKNIYTTSFRPSVIFGPGDSFFTRFAALLKRIPIIFPLACPQARFAPIYVEDVGHAFAQALINPATIGQRYDLCGPRVYTLKQLVEYTARVIRRRRKVIGLNDRLSLLQARILEWLPGKPFSLDNYYSLQVDSVCQNIFPSLFSIKPRSVENIVPDYLIAHGMETRFKKYRSSHGGA